MENNNQKTKRENSIITISQKTIENYFKLLKKLNWTEFNDKLYWNEG